MTSPYHTVHVTNEKYVTTSYKHKNTSILKNKNKHVLKAKENTINLRHDKELKRKLKQYKLRHDGKEDIDVSDVSNFFVTSLIIKSPNSKELHKSDFKDIDHIRPKNYLFKMGRQSSRNNNSKPTNTSKERLLNDKNIDQDGNLSQNDNKSRIQTNAFQLLMDSRNKVIGSNSPGKDKTTEEVECSNLVEKKEIKAKRILLLQKMAEAKGSLKKMEIEEYQDKYIKRKMEKRAEKLKSMISNKESTSIKTTNNISKIEHPHHAEVIKPVEVKQTNVVKLNTLQIVSIFKECEMEMNISPEKKITSKEDEDFLRKLSPSLKKKENMLSYFKKIDKETVIIPDETDNDSSVIKVKVKSRNKKINKRKLSIKQISDDSSSMLLITDNHLNKIESETDSTKNNDNEQKENKNLITPPKEILEPVKASDERPKRSIKRPVKYEDDSYLSSSDDEWHIFTPKKKKTNIISLKSNLCLDKNKTSELPLVIEKSKKICKQKSIQNVAHKKPVKLAPIFATKIQASPASIEAKQKFLQSGVPEKLKKRSPKQESTFSVSTCFPVTVHIQQINLKSVINIEICHNIPPLFEMQTNNNLSNESDDLYKSLIQLIPTTQLTEKFSPPSTVDVNNILKHMKQLNRRYPVYRTYRLLKDKCRGELKENSYLELDNSIEIMNSFAECLNENPDQLSWTSKYKPSHSKQIIGNFESIKELRKWLVQWTENEAKNKMNNKSDSDSSDFYHSDTDSRESMKATNNLLIITGPVGCGKTSGVYAVATELAIKVLEVNASSKRTGKIMLQDLHEATQSHKVNRGTSGAENSQKSQETVHQSSVNSKIKKRGRPKKSKEKLTQKYPDVKTEFCNGTQSSQDTTRTAMSLILIDDADIVFEQDDGFCSAIVQLVQCSKRPVILITSTLSCPHLQRFLQIGKIIKMNPLLPRMLGTWLDLLCLANNGTCCPGIGARVLDYFKGDIRKSINFLQFYTQTENLNDDEIVASLDVNMNSQTLDEEKSNTSWADQADTADNNDLINSELNQMWLIFTCEMFDLVKSKLPIPLFNIWWNIPRLFNNKFNTTSSYIDKSGDDNNVPIDSKSSKRDSKTLDLLSNVIDAISISDMFESKISDNVCLTSLPWSRNEAHSVSEQDNVENYMKAVELSEEIGYEYVKNNILRALQDKKSENLDIMPLDFVGMNLQREKDRIISRHNNLNDCLSPSVVLDKRALALDYWSSCRTICRIEKTKTDNNSKRNNRFCHYLKSMNANCRSNSFDNLADSLCSKDLN